MTLLGRVVVFANIPERAFSSALYNNRVCCDVYFLPGVGSRFSD